MDDSILIGRAYGVACMVREEARKLIEQTEVLSDCVTALAGSIRQVEIDRLSLALAGH